MSDSAPSQASGRGPAGDRGTPGGRPGEGAGRAPGAAAGRSGELRARPLAASALDGAVGPGGEAAEQGVWLCGGAQLPDRLLAALSGQPRWPAPAGGDSGRGRIGGGGFSGDCVSGDCGGAVAGGFDGAPLGPAEAGFCQGGVLDGLEPSPELAMFLQDATAAAAGEGTRDAGLGGARDDASCAAPGGAPDAAPGGAPDAAPSGAPDAHAVRPVPRATVPAPGRAAPGAGSGAVLGVAAGSSRRGCGCSAMRR